MKKIIFVLLMIVLGSMLVVSGCGKTETTTAQTGEQQQAAEETGTPPTAPFAEEQEAAEETAAEETAAQAQASEQFLSNVRCVGMSLEAVVTNTLADKQIDLAEARIFVNGILSRVEMSCGKMVLGAGEATQCTGINGRISLAATKPNKILLRADTLQQEELVNCE